MIETVIENGGWEQLQPEALVSRAGEAAAAQTRAPELARTVTALFTSDEEVRALNRDFRGKDKPTNVLSFPAEPMPGLPDQVQPLGDLALALETCLREAEEKDISAEDHTTHLIVHGLLHLLGYDHITDDEAEEMEHLERLILARLGIGDPYVEPPGS